MTNNNVLKTKKRLTIIFTLIVTFTILGLGSGYFSIKFFREYTFETRSFQKLSHLIQVGEIGFEEFKRINNVIGKDIKKDRFNDRNKDGKLPNFENDFLRKGFFNYLEIDNGEVVSFNIKNDVTTEFLDNLLKQDYTKEKISFVDGYIFKSIKVKGKDIIIFKELKYTLGDYLNDMGFYFFIVFIFSGALYFIGTKFINKTFVPIEENMTDMKNFIHNAGHELKTPLSVIDSNTQLLKDIKSYDEEMIMEIKDESKRLNNLIDTLIKLSNIGSLKIDNTDNNLKEIIKDILNNSKEKLLVKNIKVSKRIPDDILINSDKHYLYIFLSNIIGNAIRYNKNSGKIFIKYDKGILEIRDTGIGIDDKEKQKIFDRFYKVDDSRNTPGFGIGLSLVKKIADIYSWEISIESKKGKQTSFFIKF